MYNNNSTKRRDELYNSEQKWNLYIHLYHQNFYESKIDSDEIYTVNSKVTIEWKIEKKIDKKVLKFNY